jgi:hypothetical protein
LNAHTLRRSAACGFAIDLIETLRSRGRQKTIVFDAMNYISRLFAIILSLISMGRTMAVDAPPDPQAALETAAGVSLAEVVDLEQIDSRPGDGNLIDQISLRTLLKSGDVLESLGIVQAYGGLRPPGSAPPAPDPLSRVIFRKGARYWFVWSSRHEWMSYPHGIIGWWPEEDVQAIKVIEQAIARDRFAWHPQFEPVTGVSYDRHLDAKTGKWILRGTKAGKILWEDQLESAPVEGIYGVGYVYAKKDVPDLDHVRAEPDDRFLSMVTSTKLAAGNSYGVPAGTYWLQSYLQLTTGKRLWVQVQSFEVHFAWLTRAYDRTGHPLWEHEQRYLERGGRAVGAAGEEWIKRIERTFDPATGKTILEETFRIDDGQPVKIDPPK